MQRPRSGAARHHLKHILAIAFVSAIAWAQEGAVKQTWDFESDAAGLTLPRTHASVVAATDAPGTHVLQIATDAPHHTMARIADSEAHTDFVLSLRLRAGDFEGHPPTVYLYGRQGGEGGFRGLQINQDATGVLCWHGRGERNPNFGPSGVGLARARQGWIRAKFACVGDWVAGKTWVDGGPEPRWQIVGRYASQTAGWAGFGVWTHPREPSKATVLFDDVQFEPVAAESLARHGLRCAPLPQLSTADLPQTSGVFPIGSDLGIVAGNTALRVDGQTGSITSIIDTQSGQEFVDAELCGPLFDCVLTQPANGQQRRASARDFTSVRIEAVDDSELRIIFTDHIELGLAATAAIRAGEKGTLRFGLSIENRTDWCVALVNYPIAPGPAELAGKEDTEHVLLPWQAGSLVPNTGDMHIRRSAEYPGAACAQFMARYNNRSGICWIAEDPDAHCKILRATALPNSGCALTFGHRAPEQVASVYALPYEVSVRTFHGDWMDAADIYRGWAERQPWCATKLSRRRDIPQFLKEGAGIIISGIQNPVGREKQFGAEFERLPEVLNAYRDATGLKHMVFVPYGWENRGTWAGVNYFPAIPSNETWREVNAELRRQGHRTAFLTSGYWWVLRRQKTGNGPAFDDSDQFETRGDMCVRNADGSVWHVDNYEKIREHGSWRGYSVGLCHGSKAAQKTMKDIFLNAAGIGVPLVSFDQEIGGSQHGACFHARHGHPPGYGKWMWTDFRDLCKEILEDGKPVQPELGLFLENVSEPAIPYMATYWSRQFSEVDVGTAAGRGVGLFSYLYHDYVTMIGAACVQGQGKLGTRPDSLLRCRIMANNLTRGLIPGPFMHDVPLTGGDRWRKPVSQAYQAFAKPYANFPQYLLLGKAQRPPALTCGTVRTFFYRQDNKNGKPLRPGGPPVVKVEVELDAVTAGSFEAEDGSTGTVIVNATPETQKVVVALAPDRQHALKRGHGVPVPGPAIVFGQPQLPLELEPFGVRMLVTAAP